MEAGIPKYHYYSAEQFTVESYRILDEYVVNIFLQQLLASLNDQVKLKATVLAATTVSFDFLGSPRKRIHRYYAKNAPELLIQITPFNLLGYQNLGHYPQLAAFLKYMRYDQDFKKLERLLNQFFWRISQLPTATDYSTWVGKIEELARFFPEESFLGRRFRLLKGPLTLQGSQVDKGIQENQKQIDANYESVDAAANVLGVTPTRYHENIAGIVGAHMPVAFYQKKPYSPFKHQENCLKNDPKNNKVSTKIAYQPEILVYCKNKILSLVQEEMFNPQLSQHDYESIYWIKLGRFFAGIDRAIFFGGFSALSRGLSWLYSGNAKPSPFSTPVRASLSPKTLAVQRAFEQKNSSDEVVLAALQSFYNYWQQQATTPAQITALQTLQDYIALMTDPLIASNNLELTEVTEAALKQSEQILGEHKKVKQHLAKSVSDRLPQKLIRRHTTTEVLESSSALNESAQSLPNFQVLNNLSSENIYRQIKHNADYLFGKDQDFIIHNREEGLSSEYKSLNNYLQVVQQDKTLTSSRQFFLCMLGIAVSAVAKEEARLIKEMFDHQARGSFRDQLHAAVMQCAAIPLVIKKYFPLWVGLFSPSTPIQKAFKKLIGRTWLLESHRAQPEVLPERSHNTLPAVPVVKPNKKHKTSDNVPIKEAFELEGLLDADLHYYAEEVCFHIIAVGPLRNNSSGIHTILREILSNAEFTIKNSALKFLMAVLQWYIEYKLNAKKFRRTEPMSAASRAIKQVIERIKDYLRGDIHAAQLNLQQLLTIEYKRDRGHSFHKLLQFVALKYQNTQGVVVCDLESAFEQDERRRSALAQRQETPKKPGFFGFFGGSTKQPACGTATANTTQTDDFGVTTKNTASTATMTTQSRNNISTTYESPVSTRFRFGCQPYGYTSANTDEEDLDETSPFIRRSLFGGYTSTPDKKDYSGEKISRRAQSFSSPK